MPAEKALTGWARRSRFAGSGDRAAVRDHVFDVLRARRSLAALAGGREDGRALMWALMSREGIDPQTVFIGGAYGPAPLDADEIHPASASDAIDLPEWLIPVLRADLGADFAATEQALRQRAPVMIRVNLRKTSRAQAVDLLAGDGIEAEPCEIAPTALRLGQGARKLAQTAAYRDGLVELQDGSSQGAMQMLDIAPGARVLDYCAGGGGKALALAARVDARFFAHDVDPARMSDLPARAARAGVAIQCVDGDDLSREAAFDVVLCDVPCSGSGTWRRAPDAKWRFTPERLAELTAMQDDILDRASRMTGRLVYATCSLLSAENQDRISAFLRRHPGWTVAFSHNWPVSDAGDGFFVAQLDRE